SSLPERGPIGLRVETTGHEDAMSTVTMRNEAPTVLVVDDDQAISRMAQRILAGAGYAVEAVTGVDAALQALRDRPGAFDLVLTDAMMPGGHGVTWWRDEASTPRVMMMSGYS